MTQEIPESVTRAIDLISNWMKESGCSEINSNGMKIIKEVKKGNVTELLRECFLAIDTKILSEYEFKNLSLAGVLVESDFAYGCRFETFRKGGRIFKVTFIGEKFDRCNSFDEAGFDEWDSKNPTILSIATA